MSVLLEWNRSERHGPLLSDDFSLALGMVSTSVVCWQTQEDLIGHPVVICNPSGASDSLAILLWHFVALGAPECMAV